MTLLEDYQLISLSGSVLPNTWGIIACEERGDLTLFQRSLRSGHVGPNAAIKPLGKSFYEIKPGAEENRIVGYLVDAKEKRKVLEQIIYERRKRQVTYPQAIVEAEEMVDSIMDQLKKYNQKQGQGEFNLIVFNKRYNHDGVSKLMARLGKK